MRAVEGEGAMAKGKRADELPGPPVRAIAGAVLGAVAAVTLNGWEIAWIHALGVGLPDVDGLVAQVGASAAVGALLGGVSGALGAWGAGWGLAFAFTWVGWVGSATGSRAMTDAGVPGILGLLAVTFLAGLLGQVAARAPLPRPASIGLSVTLGLLVTFVGPLNDHVLSTSADGLAVAADLIALFLAVGLGAPFAATAGTDEGPPIAPLVVGSLVWVPVYLAVSAPAVPVAPTEGEGRPVVLVVVDGLRFDRTGLGGHERATTPNLDAFARRALAFEQATATSNWAPPSLGSVLTGMLPYEHGAGAHGGETPGRGPLRVDAMTLPRWLARQGWRTVGVTGDPGLLGYGFDSGFDRWDHLGSSGPVPAVIEPLDAAGLAGWPARRDAAEVTNAAITALAGLGESRKWFLLVHYVDPAPPFRYDRADEEALGRTLRAWPADAHELALHSVDAQLPRLLDAVPDDAIVVIAGLHGIEVAEARGVGWAAPPDTVHGHTMFQEQLHVPLLLRAGVAGRVERAVSLVDVAPTLLALLEVPPLPRATGVPLEEALGAKPPKEPRPVVSQSVKWGPEQQAVRVGDDKLLLAAGGTPSFDLANDPEEKHSIQGGGERAQLEKRLAALLPPDGAGVQLNASGSITGRLGALAARAASR